MPDNWPSIEEGIQLGKGAQRRLTMVPQKFSDWCVDASEYHPTTCEGQKRLRLQMEDEIKCHMFSNRKWDSEMRDLAAASDRLEASLERMLRIGSSMAEQSMQLVEQSTKVDDTGQDNGLDSCFDHSWTPGGPGRTGGSGYPEGEFA